MRNKVYLPDGEGKRLEKAVKSKMYVQDFAKELGVNRNTVYEWFKGNNMSCYYLALACEILNISSDYILFGKTIVLLIPESKEAKNDR